MKNNEKFNNKGFTLVEILAMLVILGIIIAISVPNISGILSKQKENISIEDANKLVETAKVKVRTKSNVDLPSESQYCNIYTMAFLDTNDDYSTGTNGGTYDKLESFVIVKKIVKDSSGNILDAPSGYEYRKFEKRVSVEATATSLKHIFADESNEVIYEYYVRLFEMVDGQAMGVEIVKLEDLEKNLKSHMTTFEKKVGISGLSKIENIKASIDEIDSSLCPYIERVYVTGEATIKDVNYWGPPI